MRLFPWFRSHPRAKAAADLPDAEALLPIIQKALGLATADQSIMRMILGHNPQGASDVDQGAYLKAYETSLWANVCTFQIAKACASVPIKLRNTRSGDDIDDHDLLHLLSTVNASENWPWFCGALVSYRLLAGEGFIHLGPNARKPSAMYLLRPDRMKPEPGGGGVKNWVYTVGGQEKTIPAEEIIQCKRWSPTNDLRGQPVLQAGEISLNLDIAVRKFNNAYLRGGAIPPFLLVSPSQLNEDQVKAISKRWKEHHGGVDKAGEPAVMGNGLDAKILSDAEKKGSFIDLAKLSKGEVLALFGVPPIIAQDYSDASILANAAVQKQEFWRGTILDGEMNELLGVLNEQLAPRFGPDLELYADESAMPQLQEDEGVRWQRVSAAVGGPFLTADEGREMLGLEPLPAGGDVVLVDPNKLPLGTEPPPPPEPPPMPVPAPAVEPVAEEPVPPPKQAVPVPLPTSEPVTQHKSLAGEYGSEQHQAICKAFLDDIHPQVATFAAAVAELNVALIAEVLANLRAEEDKGLTVTVPDFRRKAVADSYLFDLNAAGKVFAEKLTPLAAKTFEQGGGRGLALIQGGSFSMDNPRAVRWLQAKELEIVTLPETLHGDIRRVLAAGSAEGATIRDLAASVKELQPGYEGWMAERVATTEVVGANNAGSLECYQQNDVERKEWSTQIDEVTRDTHRAANGQVRDVAQSFSVGIRAMQHPGDPAGGAGEICNCRCVLLPVVD